jgi:UMF1 family MFS transporter
MALITQLTGDGRYGIISLVIFFVAGILMLRSVDIERGVRLAQEVDAKMVEVE